MAHNPEFLKLVNDAKSRIQETDINGYKQMLARGEKPVLIDTREDNEWAAGHAAGAVHLGKGIIERDIETQVPDKNTKLVLYCGGGFRSALSADALQKMGYKNVISLDGGWRAWQQSGMPVERSGRRVSASPEELTHWVGTEAGKSKPVHIAMDQQQCARPNREYEDSFQALEKRDRSKSKRRINVRPGPGGLRHNLGAGATRTPSERPAYTIRLIYNDCPVR